MAEAGACGVWFRKCLRLHDNEALVKAGIEMISEMPCFFKTEFEISFDIPKKGDIP